MSRSQNDHGSTGFQGCACYSAHSVWTSLCVPSLRHGTASVPCIGSQSGPVRFILAPWPDHLGQAHSRPWLPVPGGAAAAARLIEPGAARGFRLLVGARWQSVPAGPPPPEVRPKWVNAESTAGIGTRNRPAGGFSAAPPLSGEWTRGHPPPPPSSFQVRDDPSAVTRPGASS